MKNSNIEVLKPSDKIVKKVNFLSINYLSSINPDYSAKNIHYKINIFIQILFFISLSQTPQIILLFANFVYFIQNFFKIFLFFISNPYSYYRLGYLSSILPTYSILIPLYKEVGNIKILNEGIRDIQYPDSLLDIIVLLEEDDKHTLKEIYTLKDIRSIRVIILDKSFPKTKPKALNYGYFFSKGSFLTIYDAEDKPDPDQLIKAIAKFNQLGVEYSCLQARLNFYNMEENILTKFFSIEYHHWFNVLLPGLEKLKLPIGLGGTSNHFKSNIIREIGLWDAYNVTEDADLGLRIHMKGYKTKILDSYTLEESPLDPISWILQRTRWIKGMIQTILVYIKVSIFYSNKMKKRDHLSVIIFLIFTTYSFYMLPIIVVIGFLYNNKTYQIIWNYNLAISLIYIYTSAFFSIKNTSKRKITLLNFIGLIFFPLYFLLHVISAYCALIQILFNPFKWNKTKHGISKL